MCNYKRLEYVTTNDNVGDDKRTQAVTEAPMIPRASLFFRKVSTTLLRNRACSGSENWSVLQVFEILSRKAILDKNFSPADNRSIPPLKYDYVHALVKDFPHLRFTINGGLHRMQDLKHQLSLGVHGVMLGRAVVNDPFE